jgi:aspartate aminotransferase
MKLSHLSETLLGSEIVKLGGDIREKMRQGNKIYNFTIGDFDPAVFPIPEALEEEIIRAYKEHFTNYPAAEGNLDLREAISSFTHKRESLHYPVSDILVASGGRPLIYAAFRAVCNRDDKVIYAVPSWNNNHYTHFIEGTHLLVETSPEHKFMPVARDLKPLIGGASLLALCSPQNPTGTTLSKESLEEICDLILEENASRKAGEKKLYLLYDQMYWQLTFGDTKHYDPVSLRPEMRDYTIYIDAISKAFAATGVRVGWALGPETVISKMKAILTHVGAWAPMAEQKAVARFLTNDTAIDKYLTHFKREIEFRLREIFNGFMRLKADGLPVDAIAPEGAIYLTIKIDLLGRKTFDGREFNIQSEVTAFLLDEARLAVVPFYAFGAPQNSPWYRLSVGTCKKETITEVLTELKRALEKII